MNVKFCGSSVTIHPLTPPPTKLVSPLARVRNSRDLLQSNVQMCVIYFCLGLSFCPYYRGVCYSEVSTRRQLSVPWNPVNTVTDGSKKLGVLTGWLYYQGRLKFHDLRAVMTNTQYITFAFFKQLFSPKCRYNN